MTTVDFGERCVSCGAASGTAFCASCGERRAADRPHGLRALAEELWDALSPIDGRIGRTAWTLVRRPGALTVAYMRGVRVPYVPPLRLFLLVNLLFFVHASAVGNHTFDTPLTVHLNHTQHAAVATRLVRAKLGRLVGGWKARERRDPTRSEVVELTESYGRRFNANTTLQAKSLIIVMVPMFAVLVGLVEWRRRPALQALAFALHALSMILLVIVVSRYAIGYPLAAAFALTGFRPGSVSEDLWISMPMLAAFGVWLQAALRRAYGEPRVTAWVKAALLCVGFGVVLFAYRALLFFTVFYTT